MSKLPTVTAALGLLCAVATAQLSPSGINTYTKYNGNPVQLCDIECWRSQPQDFNWSYHSTHNTDEQHWPPDSNRLRWAHSSQSDPKVVIDTGYYYTFKAKKYIGGQWRWTSPDIEDMLEGVGRLISEEVNGRATEVRCPQDLHA